MEKYRLWRLMGGGAPPEKLAEATSTLIALEYALAQGPGRYRITDFLGPLVTFQIHLEACAVLPRRKEIH